MYSEWYGVCDFIVLWVVEVCVDYDGVNVFHVCLDFCVVYDVWVCVNVYGVVCVVCFLRLCVVCCSVVGVWGIVMFILSVMYVVGGVSLWVACVFRRVDVCLCLLCTQICVFV